MPNLAALEPMSPPEASGGLILPPSVTGAPVDVDGLPIPTMWQASSRWMSLPIAYRRKRSAEFIEEEIAKAVKRPPGAKTYAPRFSTDYAIKYGRKQGWKLIERESYDYRTKRHHDLELGVDAIFDDGNDGRVGIQGAGKSERKAHYQRFIDRGGPEKAQRRHMRILYLEFVRGNPEPVLSEWWA